MNRPTYTLIARLLLPAALLRLLWRSLRQPGYRRRWRERLGHDAHPPAPGGVWVHAVSVGEVQAALPLLQWLLSHEPHWEITVTTTTPTGAQRVVELLGDRVHHRYTPFDLPGIVARVLDQRRPRLLVIFETELWPNLLDACRCRNIPLVLANGRLSERSLKGYQRLQPLVAETLAAFTWVTAQSNRDATRFLALGADPARVVVTGNIKFDATVPHDLAIQASALRLKWGDQRPVWIGASTHEGEETLLLQAHRQLLQVFPDALMILAPRHPERFSKVAGLIENAGFPFARRSREGVAEPRHPVFLLDRLGELLLAYAASDVACVGGSWVPVGGHNLLEPASLGVPVLFGPHTGNFVEIAALLEEAGGGVRVQTADQLVERLRTWFANPLERTRVGHNGQRAVAANRGALERLVGLLKNSLLTKPAGQ